MTTSPTRATSLETALALHRAGRLDEAAAHYLRSIEAQPDCAIALNMLGNIEYQRSRFDEARRLIAQAIAIDPASAAYRITMGHVQRRSGDLASAAGCYREALDRSPDSTLAAIHLAEALAGLGDLAGAADVLRAVLDRDPAHRDALERLGDFCIALERPAEAASCFDRLLAIEPASEEAAFRLGVARWQEGCANLAADAFERALALRPDFSEAAFNLGVIAADAQDSVAAEGWLRRALAIRPDYVDAGVNLSAVLAATGRAAEASVYREAAYRKQCIFVQRSPTALRSVLLLFDAGKGNVNLGHLFPRSRNETIDWMIEYASPGQSETLPRFDLVFNAMGDADIAGDAVKAAAAFLEGCATPVLNRPEAVARTARDRLPRLLEGIGDLVVPEVRRLPAGTSLPVAVADGLPVLVRPVDTHGGGGLERALCAADLARIGSARAGKATYVSSFCDFRSSDGWYRKYRVIYIDRKPFAYHLAISPHWLVHYATAGMEAHPWKLDEERHFLENPRDVLGSNGMAAIDAVGERLDLDYAGMDFSRLADGRILVFEANPVMLVHPEDPQGVLAFKNAAVTTILDAFEQLVGRASVTPDA